ncbi:MAG TPA: tetratricopeptide repeat protein [Polyangiaceae bacterium]|nr:tetratricopeptide repeat protein [Polyangiaceae bacterium]
MDAESVPSAELLKLVESGTQRCGVLIAFGVILVAGSYFFAHDPVLQELTTFIRVSRVAGVLLCILGWPGLAAWCARPLDYLWRRRAKAPRVVVWLTRSLWHLRPNVDTLFLHQACLEWAGDREAVQISERILGLWVQECFPPEVLNKVVNTFITFGRYREALELTPPWNGGGDDRHKVIQVNLVEAEYNLGLLSDARSRIDRLKQAPPEAQWLDAGLRLQEAWLLTLEGQEEAGLALAQGVDPEHLPDRFRAEVHFARGFALIELERFEQARTEIRQGLARSLRPSSVRNGHFLLGCCEQKAGELDAAVKHFARGAAMPYTGQGGDALLAYGRTLEDLGRTEQARKIFDLLLQRDPQSHACAFARVRLQVISAAR